MDKTALVLLIILLIFIGFQSFMSVSTAKTEKQPYRVVKKENEFEIRYYPPAVYATISSSAKTYRELANSGFRRIAGYIFGNNESSTKIAMTAPVHMDINERKSSMSFVMPSQYKLGDLPAPNDAKVIIHETTGEYVAAIGFSGFASDQKIKKYTEQLRRALEEKGIQSTSHFRYLGYNPPFRLIGRKNEVVVTVQWNEQD